MLNRHEIARHVRHLERELAKAKEREFLLVEMIKRSQQSHERDILNLAVFRRRYRSN